VTVTASQERKFIRRAHILAVGRHTDGKIVAMNKRTEMFVKAKPEQLNRKKPRPLEHIDHPPKYLVVELP